MCLANNIGSERDYQACLDFHAQNFINLTPFNFQASYLFIKEFEEWLSTYHLYVCVDYSTLLQRLTDIFSSMQKQTKKKSRGMHIKKVQDFQNYFETVYAPYKLSWTIFETALSLKLKINDKISKLNFPPYVKDKYGFTLEFHIPKFPLLPTCEHGLAFQLSLTNWCFCGS